MNIKNIKNINVLESLNLRVRNLLLVFIYFIFLFFLISGLIYSQGENNNQTILYYQLESVENISNNDKNDKKGDNNKDIVKSVLDFYISKDKIRLNAKQFSTNQSGNENQLISDSSIILEENDKKVNLYILDNLEKYYAIVNQENIPDVLQNDEKIKEFIYSVEIKKEGNEKVGDFNCEKYAIFYKGQKAMELFTIDYKSLISSKDFESFKNLYLESNLYKQFGQYFNELGNKLSSKISPESFIVKYNFYENNNIIITTILKEIKFIKYDKKYFDIPTNYKKIEFK